MNKTEIKKVIEDTTLSIHKTKHGQTFNFPIILTFYLGKETYNNVNASIKDAFTSCLTASPYYYEMLLDGSNTNNAYDFIISSLKDASKTLKQRDVRCIFIGLMEDPFFDDVKSQVIEDLKINFTNVGNMGIPTNKVAFYGIFDQNKMYDENKNQKDYTNAFEFIDEGHLFFKNIYHIEKRFELTDYTQVSRTIALNSIIDDYLMPQLEKNYNWKSLCLYGLSIPEFIISNVLFEIYDKQIDNDHMDEEQFKKSIQDNLDNSIINQFDFENYDAYKYVPLKVPAVKKKGFFDKVKDAFDTVAGNPEEAEVHSLPLWNSNDIKKILNELVSKIKLADIDFDEILENIILSCNSLDSNPTVLTQSIVSAFDQKINKLKLDYKGLEAQKQSTVSFNNLDWYLEHSFEHEKELYICNHKIEVLTEFKNQIINNNNLIRIVNEITTENQNLKDSISNLCAFDYGGNIQEGTVKLVGLPFFTINEPVSSILEDIGMNSLITMVNNKETILAKLDDLISYISQNGMFDQTLGQNHGNYGGLHSLKYNVILTNDLRYDNDVAKIINDNANFTMVANDLARDNTFYIISNQEFSSQYYITRYKNTKED